MAVTFSRAPVLPTASSTALIPAAQTGTSSLVDSTVSSPELAETNAIAIITNLFAQVQEAQSEDSKHQVSTVISAQPLQQISLPQDYTITEIVNFYQKDLAPLLATSFKRVALYFSVGNTLLRDQCVCAVTAIYLKEHLNFLQKSITIFQGYRDIPLAKQRDNELVSYVYKLVENVNLLRWQANNMQPTLMKALTEATLDKLLKNQLLSLSHFDIQQIENA